MKNNPWLLPMYWPGPDEKYMGNNKVYRTTERFSALDVGGVMVSVYYTEDLTNDAIYDSFVKHFDNENWEYCAALAAEANKRGWKLKNPR